MKDVILLGVFQIASVLGYFLNKGEVREGFLNISCIVLIAIILYVSVEFFLK